MKQKKKIIILAMGANVCPHTEWLKCVNDTFAKSLINNEYDNIKYFYYTGDSNDELICNNNHIITKASDKNTMSKTIEVFKYILNNYDFDFIFRTNLSNYINIKLLDAFIQRLNNDIMNIYGSDKIYKMYHNNNIVHSYIRGNSMIISRKMIKELINEYDNNEYDEVEYCDDELIGRIYFNWYLNHNMNPDEHIKSYSQA